MRPATPQFQPSETIHAVQYLRGFAAIAVFLFHISSLTVALWGPSAAGVDHVGAAGVDLFFVISGFVMAMILSRPGPLSVRSFLIQRVARVIPGYYVATVGVFALALAAPSIFLSTSADPFALFRSLAFLPIAGKDGSMAPLLVVGWTLDYEIYFYLVCALTAALFGRAGLVATSVLLTIFVACGLAFAPANPTLRFYTDPIVIEFVYGIAIWFIYASGVLDRWRWISVVAFAGGILLLLLQWERDPGHFRSLVWGLPSALILLGSLKVMTFKSPSLALLGDWSYAFYLTHLFVIFGYVRIIMPRIPELELIWPYHYFAMTVLGLGAAWLYHRLVEVPARDYIRRRYGKADKAGKATAPVAADLSPIV